MNTRCLMMLAAWLLFAGAAPSEEPRGADGKALQGTWQAASIEEGGKQQPKDGIEKVKLTIHGEKFTIRDGDNSLEGTFTIDTSTKPKTFDAEALGQSGKPTRILGIYKLDGDTLTICYDGQRPSEFKTAPKSGLLLVVWKRAK